MRTGLCAVLDTTETEQGFTADTDDTRQTAIDSGRAGADDAAVLSNDGPQ